MQILGVQPSAVSLRPTTLDGSPNLRASVSFTIASAGPPFRSAEANSRPASTRVPIVLKKDGATLITSVNVDGQGPAPMKWPAMKPVMLSGSVSVPLTPDTPGTARI